MAPIVTALQVEAEARELDACDACQVRFLRSPCSELFAVLSLLLSLSFSFSFSPFFSWRLYVRILVFLS